MAENVGMLSLSPRPAGRVSQAFAKSGKWMSPQTTAERKSYPALTSTWRSRDRVGKPWTGVVTIETAPASGGSHEYTVTFAVTRAG
jgi:hypothetical protein